MNQPTANLARYVRDLVNRSGLTPAEISQRIGVGKNTVGRWAQGKQLRTHVMFMDLISCCEAAARAKEGSDA